MAAILDLPGNLSGQHYFSVQLDDMYHRAKFHVCSCLLTSLFGCINILAAILKMTAILDLLGTYEWQVPFLYAA